MNCLLLISHLSETLKDGCAALIIIEENVGQVLTKWFKYAFSLGSISLQLKIGIWPQDSSSFPFIHFSVQCFVALQHHVKTNWGYISTLYYRDITPTGVISRYSCVHVGFGYVIILYCEGISSIWGYVSIVIGSIYIPYWGYISICIIVILQNWNDYQILAVISGLFLKWFNGSMCHQFIYRTKQVSGSKCTHSLN